MMQSLLEDMLSSCVTYFLSVIEFKKILETEGLGDAYDAISKVRGSSHDSMIDSVNILARSLNKQGKNGAWVGEFGGERSKYGKFAILLTLSRLTEE